MSIGAISGSTGGMSAISYFQLPTDEQMDAMDAQMAA